MPVIKKVKGIAPKWGERCFIADNATLIGDVSMGQECSVWFGAVVRADVHYIKIGNRSNIQDNAVIHGTYQKAPTEIGNNVSIGHNAIVHGCTIHDNVVIGMGAIVMDNAVVQSNVFVAAGAVVLENSVLESGYLYAGVPAKKVKPLDERLYAEFERISKNYVMYASWIED